MVGKDEFCGPVYHSRTLPHSTICAKVWVHWWLKEKVINSQINLWSALAISEPMSAFQKPDIIFQFWASRAEVTRRITLFLQRYLVLQTIYRPIPVETINAIDQFPFVFFLSIYEHNEDVGLQNKQGQVLNAKKKSKISIHFFQNLCSCPGVHNTDLICWGKYMGLYFKVNSSSTNLPLALLMNLNLRPG